MTDFIKLTDFTKEEIQHIFQIADGIADDGFKKNLLVVQQAIMIFCMES